MIDGYRGKLGASECNDGYSGRLVMEHLYINKSQN